MSRYKVWECKIVVPADTKLPSGFDSPPRSAAQEAVENAGIEVLDVFSGWGGSLDKIELKIVDEDYVRFLKSELRKKSAALADIERKCRELNE